jgi:hypothetical protein
MTTTHPLVALREKLLDDPDIAAKLKLGDQYLQTMVKMGSSFVLPHDHAELLPILEYYQDDLVGWCNYVKGIRNRMAPSDRMSDVHDVFRTIEVRRVQAERRSRLDAAIKKALQLKRIEDTSEAKKHYANRCTQEWIKQRTAMLSGMRGRNGRVNEDERAVALDAFWAAIDEGITLGEIPDA